jgi:ribonuclease HII
MTTAAPPKIEKAPVETTAGKLAQTKPPRLRTWLTFAGRLIFWQIVAILFAEFTLSLAGLGEEEIYKLHPKYGFVHMNNKRVTWRSEGYSKSFFGPDGMREPNLTIQKPAGVFRVALLGDSIVESLQVPLEETFGQKLEKQLKKSADGKELQILNFGNSGYSTAQEYLQLKDKVLKYSPDAVIVFYNHRDLFENWSPPDQTITNVRPYALHLPGQPLTVDNSSVKQWMNSPRGKFLRSIEWVRENSRIWGLISAWETQASFHDPVYRTVVAFFTSPVKQLQEATKQISQITPQTILTSMQNSFSDASKSASFKIKFIDEKQNTATKTDAENKTVAAKSVSAKDKKDHSKDELDPAKASYILDAPDLKDFPSQASAAETEAKAKEKKAVNDYLNLMFKTLRSMLTEMNDDCKKHGAKFAVAAAPSKLALVESADKIGMMDLSYDGQIVEVKKICEQLGIPFADMQADLQAMPRDEANKCFYAMHLTPQGHDYVVKESQGLFKTLLRP